MTLRALLFLALSVASPALAQDGGGWTQKPPAGALNRVPGTWVAPPLPKRATVPLATIFYPNWYLSTQNVVPGGIDYMLPGVRTNRAGYIDQSSIVLAPPAEYDRPFRGDLIVIRISMQHIKEMCPPFQPGVPPVACATHDNPATWCRVVLAHDDEFQAVGWRSDPILRHEIAHCNGWPADHPGARQ